MLREEGSLPEDETPASIAEFFTLLASQPVSDNLHGPVVFNESEPHAYVSRVLGMQVVVHHQSSETSILVAESVVGAIEALFATAPEVGAAAHTENFGIWIQESADVLEPDFTVDQERMAATVNWPAGLVPATYGRQDEVQRTLIGLAATIFAATCFVKDMQQMVERFLTNEAVLDRVSMIVVVGNSRQRIFKKAVSKLSDWTQLVTTSFPLESTRPSISRRALGSAEDDDDAAADDRRSPSLPKDHRDLGVRSVIDLHLWNRAGWTGAAFADWGPAYPPAIALMFTDEDAARKIFERWRERFGEIDKDGDIYVAIVRGISAEYPAHYRVLITSRLSSEDGRSGNRSLMVASRVQTMHAESDANLMRFLHAYGRSQAYLLMPAILRGGGSPQFLPELAILKRRLNVKKASEVSLLQKSRFARDFLQREAKVEGAGGHFWHDEALTQTPQRPRNGCYPTPSDPATLECGPA